MVAVNLTSINVTCALSVQHSDSYVLSSLPTVFPAALALCFLLRLFRCRAASVFQFSDPSAQLYAVSITGAPSPTPRSGILARL
jgi:hypothetical protein